nr:hypothetical protein CFP56_17290 [Quercus suber]
MEGMLDAQGVWQEDEEVMGEMVLDCYTDLFTSSNPTGFDEILEAVQPKVTSSMNQKLTMEFTADEVNVVLKQMYPLKAPGPDTSAFVIRAVLLIDDYRVIDTSHDNVPENNVSCISIARPGP